MSLPLLIDTLYVGPSRCGRTRKLRDLRRAARGRVLQPFNPAASEGISWDGIPVFCRQAGPRIIVIDDIDFLAKVEQARLHSLLPHYSTAPPCPVIATCRRIDLLIAPLRERFNVVCLPPLAHGGDKVEENGPDLLGFIQRTDLDSCPTPFLYRLCEVLADPEETYVPYRLCQELALAAGLGTGSEEPTKERIALENLLRGKPGEPAERDAS